MYKIIDRKIEGLPTASRIGELSIIHPLMVPFLEDKGFEVHHEKQAFRLKHTNYAIAHRTDFLAFRGQDILIVECKGAPLAKSQVFGGILQITMYMRMYRMLQAVPKLQLALEGLDPEFVRGGKIRGALAVPKVALTKSRVNMIQAVYDGLKLIDLIEPNLEVWSLIPNED